MSSDVFEKLAIFEGLSSSQIALLRPLFVPCDFYADEFIFEQGDPADYLYVVVVGEVVVKFKPDDGAHIVVAHVKPGGVVGWSAALGSRSYTSGAMTTTYTQLLRVRGSDLREISRKHPDIGDIILDRLAAVIAQRLSNAHPQIVALLQIGLRSMVQKQEVKNGSVR